MINRFKAFAAVSCLGMVACLTPQLAQADQWNKKTILTVNEPIQLPGAVLQPGKYVMKLLDSPSNRHIVQVFNDREDHLYTTILAIPNYRLQPTGNTEFQWWEVPAGQPRAMRAWFYPGDNFGQEFAYPKTAAIQIAQVNTAPVPTTEAQSEADMATAKVTAVDKTGTEQELDRNTYSANNNENTATNNQPTETAQNTMPAATEQANTNTNDNGMNNNNAANNDMGASRARTLPSTGSPFPLFALAGFVALGGSTIVRALAKRA